MRKVVSRDRRSSREFGFCGPLGRDNSLLRAPSSLLQLYAEHCIQNAK